MDVHKAAAFLILALFLAPAFAYPLLGSYALEILPPPEEPKKEIDFSYSVECDGSQAVLTVRVYDKERPSREVDATVALRPSGSSYYEYVEDTSNGEAVFEGVEPGTYDISIRPESSAYESLKEEEAVEVGECAEENRTNDTEVGILPTESGEGPGEAEEEEGGERVAVTPGGGVLPSVRESVSRCSAKAESFFYTVGENITFILEKDGLPYQGTAILEGPHGRKEVAVNATYTFEAEKEGYYTMEIPKCMMVEKDYVVVAKPPAEEKAKRYEVKGIRAYNGCVLTFFSDKPYQGLLVDEEGNVLKVPRTVGEYRVVLKDGVYDLSMDGEVKVSLRCPEKRFFFERDLSLLLAALAVILAILYFLFLFSAIEVSVERKRGKLVLRAYRKLSKRPVKDLRLVVENDKGEVVYEDLTDEKGEVPLPRLPPGEYRVKVGSSVKARFTV